MPFSGVEVQCQVHQLPDGKLKATAPFGLGWFNVEAFQGVGLFEGFRCAQGFAVAFIRVMWKRIAVCVCRTINGARLLDVQVRKLLGCPSTMVDGPRVVHCHSHTSSVCTLLRAKKPQCTSWSYSLYRLVYIVCQDIHVFIHVHQK